MKICHTIRRRRCRIFFSQSSLITAHHKICQNANYTYYRDKMLNEIFTQHKQGIQPDVNLIFLRNIFHEDCNNLIILPLKIEKFGDF